jgi:amino acid permease
MGAGGDWSVSISLSCRFRADSDHLAVIIAETISLGVLSLPNTLATLGYVPGLILIFSFGLLAWYTGYATWKVKMHYGDRFKSFADGMAILAGKPGRIFGEIAQAVFLIFVVAAHVVTFSIELNTLSEHGLCTVVFMVIGDVVMFLCTLPRDFKANSWFSIVCAFSLPLLPHSRFESRRLTF